MPRTTWSQAAAFAGGREQRQRQREPHREDQPDGQHQQRHRQRLEDERPHRHLVGDRDAEVAVGSLWT